MPVKLHAHQEVAVEKMHNGCVLYGGVGVGKTITSLGYYYEKVCGGVINKWGSMETPKDVYVITTATVRDKNSFELQAAQFGVHADPAISTNGVKITVDSWNNLHKYVGVENAFFIFDEQRVVGYGAWARAFIKIARDNEWVLLSATPGDTWLDYIPVFIANDFYRNKTDFVDQHVIWTPRVKYPKVLRYQDPGKLVRLRNQVLVHMPFERHTKRHPVDIVCGYDTDLFERAVKKRWHVFEKRPLRDVAELFSVMRKIVNSDSSRLDAVQTLTQRHPKLIVFYNFDYELEMLRELGQTIASSTSETNLLSSSPGSSDPSGMSPKSETQTKVLNLTSPSSMTVTGLGSDRPSWEENGEKGAWIEDSTGQERFFPTLVSPSAKTSSSSSSKGASTSDSLPSSSRGSKTSSSPASTKSSGRQSSKLKVVPSLSSGEFAVAEWNGHKHEPIPATERWLYLVQYKAGAEGWNCIETDAIAFFSQTYSYRDWWQAHGRIDRINTPFVDLHYYYLISRSAIDLAIRKALRAKKSFNERDLDLKAA